MRRVRCRSGWRALLPVLLLVAIAGCALARALALGDDVHEHARRLQQTSPSPTSPASGPTPGATTPSSGPTPGATTPSSGPTPGATTPSSGPTPGATTPSSGPTPGATTPSSGPTPGATTPSSGPSPGATTPSSGPTPGATTPSSGPTPGATTPSSGPTPGATTPSSGPTPGATTPSSGATPGATTPSSGPTPGATTPSSGPTPGATTPSSGPTADPALGASPTSSPTPTPDPTSSSAPGPSPTPTSSPPSGSLTANIALRYTEGSQVLDVSINVDANGEIIMHSQLLDASQAGDGSSSTLTATTASQASVGGSSVSTQSGTSVDSGWQDQTWNGQIYVDPTTGVIIMPQQSINTNVTTNVTAATCPPGATNCTPGAGGSNVQNQVGTQLITVLEIYAGDDTTDLIQALQRTGSIADGVSSILNQVTGRLTNIGESAAAAAGAGTDPQLADAHARIAQRLSHMMA